MDITSLYLFLVWVTLSSFHGGFVSASYHWTVTETGRIDGKVESAFPLRHGSDLLAMLEQERRSVVAEEMQEKLVHFKQSVDTKWEQIELETAFEQRLYATDKHCISAQLPLSRFQLHPAFVDVFVPNRPKLARNPFSTNPPDCRKFYSLDFSLLTFPHLKSLRDRENLTCGQDKVETDAPFDINVAAMLQSNSTDWTAYNLATLYWHMRRNGTQAMECARRAVHLAPREWRHVTLLNLGTLLQACHSLGEAAIVLHAAVDMDRNQYRSHVALGHVYTLLGDYQRAAGCYENALSLQPTQTYLAQQHAAVLCHQKLIAGLWAIDAALKKIVNELEEYSHLQEQYVLTQTRIGLERANGPKPSSSISTPQNLGLLWEAVEHQAFLLTERMSQAEPRLTRVRHPHPSVIKEQERKEKEKKEQPDVPIQRNTLNTETMFDCAVETCPNYMTTPPPPSSSSPSSSSSEITPQEMVAKLKELRQTIVALPGIGDYKPELVKGKVLEALEQMQVDLESPESPPATPLQKCLAQTDRSNMMQKCRHHFVTDHPPSPIEGGELLDESTIENFHSDSYRDTSDL